MANRLIKSTHFSRNCFFLFRNFYIAIDPEQIRNIFFFFDVFFYYYFYYHYCYYHYYYYFKVAKETY